MTPQAIIRDVPPKKDYRDKIKDSVMKNFPAWTVLTGFIIWLLLLVSLCNSGGLQTQKKSTINLK